MADGCVGHFFSYYINLFLSLEGEITQVFYYTVVAVSFFALFDAGLLVRNFDGARGECS